ncbi:MAG: nucleotidyltransferase domain-containing protein [Lentisphaerota bacterium]
MEIELLKQEIVQRLKALNPEKIILFGSYAYGSPTKDSDIDLYVVTNDNFIPQSFKENMEIKLKVANQLKSLQAIIPIDTITHTKQMSEKFIELNSSFSREIFQKGIYLYDNRK